MKPLLLFLLCTNMALAQDSSVRYTIDNVLTLRFGGQPDSATHEKGRIVFFNDEYVSYQVIVPSGDVSALNNERDFKKAMNELVEGYLSNDRIKLYQTKVSDTTFAGTKGKMIHVFNPSEATDINEWFTFVTAQNNRPYMVQVLVLTDAVINEESISAFFNSLRFHGKTFSRKNQSAFFEKYGRITNIVMPVFILAIIVALIIRSRRKENSTNG